MSQMGDPNWPQLRGAAYAPVQQTDVFGNVQTVLQRVGTAARYFEPDCSILFWPPAT